MSKYPPQHGASKSSIGEFGTRQLHQPVLVDAVLRLLAPLKGESYLDLTAGYGGHATRVIQKTENVKQATLVDRDEQAINFLQSSDMLAGARLLHKDFAAAAADLIKLDQQFDMVLLDLGVSSPQLDEGERGFSFRTDAPLDMRMDQRQTRSAEWLVNHLGQAELSKLIRDFGEEPPRSSARIAAAILAARPISSTGRLATIIKQAHRGAWKKIHPATRTFQAIRIATNDELAQLEAVLPLLPPLLSPGGRVAIISFHSLEDAIVKRFLKNEAESGYEASLKLLTKKVVSGAYEDVTNPRARSAKLRAAVKINTTGKDLDYVN